MATQKERRAATRARLIDAARQLWVAEGYDAVSTTQILESAGVSRGAMYHHFDTKLALFEAVFRQVSETLVTRIIGHMAGVPPQDAVVAGCLAWLEEVRRPDIAQIVLIEGPKALGFDRWRELDAEYTMAQSLAAVRAAVSAGTLALPNVELGTRAILGLVLELAYAVLGAEDPDAAMADAEATIRAFLRPPSR